MAPRLGTLGVALGLALAAPAPALAGPLAKALDHLAARQDPVAGGFAEFGGTDATYSSWAALAVAGAGENAARWRSGLATLRDAVSARLRLPTLGEIELAAVAAAAAGVDPRSVGGRNAVRVVLAAQRADGSIGGSPSTTAWGILALRAGGLDRGARAVRRARGALVRQQNRDGGWSTGPESPGSGPNTTAAAVQGLWAAGARLEVRSELDRASTLERARRLPPEGPERRRRVRAGRRRDHPGSDDRLGDRRPQHDGRGPRAPALEPVGRAVGGAARHAARQRRGPKRARLVERLDLGHLPGGAGLRPRPAAARAPRPAADPGPHAARALARARRRASPRAAR